MEKTIKIEGTLSGTNMETLLDFTVLLGERIQVCGGELWRTEEMIRCVFHAYGVRDVQIFLLPHLLLVSIRGDTGPQVTRQKAIGDTAVDLEELTRLNRLVRQVCLTPPDPDTLLELLTQVSHVPGYCFPQVAGGMVLALLSLVYLFGGGGAEAVLSVVGILLVMGMQRFLNRQIREVNKMALNAASTFLTGTLALLISRFWTLDPYLVMIVVAFGLMPGVPLINSFRELLCGRVMTGSLLVLQVLAETLSIVAGYYLSIVCFA